MMSQLSSKSNEQQNSTSWFSSLTLPTNITSQLSSLSSTLVQATSTVGNAANTFQKSIQDRFLISNGTEPNSSEVPKTNKDFKGILNGLSASVYKGAQQLKQVVEENTIIGSFSKEQDKFVTEKRTQQKREEAAVPPWVGYDQEEEIKQQILALSKEKRNFLRSPPPGANYYFDMTAMYPVALATLEFDGNLKAMRFSLVPKEINEESFWCNYFYRVSLTKQSAHLSALTTNTPVNEDVHQASNNRVRLASDLHDRVSDANQEFVSEDYDTSALSMDEIRREIEQLTTAKKNTQKAKSNSPDLDESEWDKGLADELENVSTEELEAQINQLLGGNTN